MADSLTPNLSLVKMQPGTHRDDWGDVANQNLDKIDVAAGTANAALPKAGGTVTGEILRDGQGAHVHWATPGLSDGDAFLSPAGGPSPLTLPGQIWFGYSA
jgi:hypothetical protein